MTGSTPTTAFTRSPAGGRREIDVILADAERALRHHGETRLAAEVEEWNATRTRASRGVGLLLAVGFLLATCSGVAVWGLRSGFWEWTVAATVFAGFGLFATLWLVHSLNPSMESRDNA
jgi:hypothetical protein